MDNKFRDILFKAKEIIDVAILIQNYPGLVISTLSKMPNMMVMQNTDSLSEFELSRDIQAISCANSNIYAKTELFRPLYYSTSTSYLSDELGRVCVDNSTRVRVSKTFEPNLRVENGELVGNIGGTYHVDTKFDDIPYDMFQYMDESALFQLSLSYSYDALLGYVLNWNYNKFNLEPFCLELGHKRYGLLIDTLLVEHYGTIRRHREAYS